MSLDQFQKYLKVGSDLKVLDVHELDQILKKIGIAYEINESSLGCYVVYKI